MFIDQKVKNVNNSKKLCEKIIKTIPKKIQKRIQAKIEKKRVERCKYKLMISKNMAAKEIIIFEKCKETKIFKENCVNKLLNKFKNISELNFDFGTKKKKKLVLFLNYFLTISIKYKSQEKYLRN